MHFKNYKCDFLLKSEVTGILCTARCKRTLVLWNGEVACRGKFVQDKKNNRNPNGVDVSALPCILSIQYFLSYTLKKLLSH